MPDTSPTRFPLLPEPENRLDDTDRDARLVNGFLEAREDGKVWVYKRPGLAVYQEPEQLPILANITSLKSRSCNYGLFAFDNLPYGASYIMVTDDYREYDVGEDIVSYVYAVTFGYVLEDGSIVKFVGGSYSEANPEIPVNDLYFMGDQRPVQSGNYLYIPTVYNSDLSTAYTLKFNPYTEVMEPVMSISGDGRPEMEILLETREVVAYNQGTDVDSAGTGDWTTTWRAAEVYDLDTGILKSSFYLPDTRGLQKSTLKKSAISTDYWMVAAVRGTSDTKWLMRAQPNTVVAKIDIKAAAQSAYVGTFPSGVFYSHLKRYSDTILVVFRVGVGSSAFYGMVEINETTNSLQYFNFDVPEFYHLNEGYLLDEDTVVLPGYDPDDNGVNLYTYSFDTHTLLEKAGVPPEYYDSLSSEGTYTITVKEGSEVWVNVYIEDAFDEFGNFYEEWATISIDLEERVPV